MHGGVGSISGWEAKIPCASRPKNENKKQEKQYYNKLNKDLKKWSTSNEIFQKNSMFINNL